KRAQIAVAVDDQWVDLDEIDVLFHEQSIEGAHDLDELLDLLCVEPHAKADVARLVGHETRGRVDRRGNAFFGRVGGNLFDIDPAGGRAHEHDRLEGTVNQSAKIELLLDVGGLGNQHRVDRQRAATRLVGLDL